MATTPPINRTPQWIIAFSLATIALCLLAFLVKSFLPEPSAPPPVVQSEPPQPPAEPVPQPAKPPRGVAASRSAPSRQAQPEPAQVEISLAQVTVETVAPAETHVLNQTFYGAPDVVITNPPPVGGGENHFGSIVGQVIFLGTPPPESPIPSGIAAECGPNRPRTTRHYVVGPNGGLADVVLRLKGDLPACPATGANLLVFARCQLDPYISAMTVQQKLRVQNTDSTLHGPRADWDEDNRLVLHSNSSRNLPIKTPPPGLFQRLRCEVHPWEIAYVSVFNHPYFAVTDNQGRFSIQDVPPGEYIIEALHRKTHGTNGVNQSLTIHPGEISTVEFQVSATNASTARVLMTDNR